MQVHSLPKTRWRKWLKEPEHAHKDYSTIYVQDLNKKQVQRKKQRYWKMWFEIRKRAQREMDDLIFILEQLQKNSKHPDLQFMRIFRDEDRYFRLLKTLSDAYDLSLRPSRRLLDPQHLPITQDALSKAGLGYYSKTQLKDTRLRERLLEKLEQIETEDGISYREALWRQIKAPTAMYQAKYAIERSKKLVANIRKEHASDPVYDKEA